MGTESSFDVLGLIINLGVIILGFAVYVIFFRSKLGKSLEKYQYPVFLVILVLVCILGNAIRAVAGI